MYISMDGQTFKCELGDNGTIDTLVYIDGVDHVIECETASEYRDDNGTMTKEGFIKLCQWLIPEVA